jgi:hypothetical protein
MCEVLGPDNSELSNEFRVRHAEEVLGIEGARL